MTPRPILPTVATMLAGLAALAALAAPAVATAQTVWRCGEGTPTYTQIPCEGGREVAAADARSADQVQAARGVAARERRLADELTAERHQREMPASAAPRTHGRAAAQLRPAADRQPSRRPARAKPRLEDAGTWRAVVPASRPRPG